MNFLKVVYTFVFAFLFIFVFLFVFVYVLYLSFLKALHCFVENCNLNRVCLKMVGHSVNFLKVVFIFVFAFVSVCMNLLFENT